MAVILVTWEWEDRSSRPVPAKKKFMRPSSQQKKKKKKKIKGESDTEVLKCKDTSFNLCDIFPPFASTGIQMGRG
jgi:hypothetical protein